MLGVPVLLVTLAVLGLVGISGPPVRILLAAVAAGCLVYGAVAVRLVYLHGRRKSAAHPR